MDKKVCEENFSECFQSLLEVSDSKAYIQALKQVLAETKANDKYLRDPKVCESIACIYYKCPPKNSVRRVLISYIGSLADKSTLKECLQQQLVQQLELSNGDWNNVAVLRCRVDTISSLMDNFPTGEECLGTISHRVLKFLAQALSRILKLYSDLLSPVQKNEIMHLCLTTIQSSNRILQKYITMATKKCSEHESQELQDICTQYLESDVLILMKGDFLSDCCCGCAMNIALLLKATAIDNIPHLLLSVLFPNTNTSNDFASYALPDWLAASDIIKMNVTNLPIGSQLCVIFGLLAKMDISELMVEITPGKTSLVFIFLDQLLTFCKQCSDTSNKVLLAKSLALWTSRMCTGLECKCVPCAIRPSLSGEGSTVKDILQYVWTAWDDQIDVIRQNAKNTFENCIKIHILASETEPRTDPFIMRVTRELLNVNWSNKGKYGALASMATILGMTGLLELWPLISTELIEQLKEHTSASQASDLYDRLSRTHQLECRLPETDSLKSETRWLKLWCEPVISALCDNHRAQKNTIVEYVLPKLLKTSKAVLPYIIEQLTVTVAASQSQTCALITCLRRARSLGQLQHSAESSISGEATLWYGLVRVDVLKYALTCLDDQVRLDAFALLCENNKTTEPISELEFNLVRYFLPFNLNNQSPAFRQHLLSYVQKLFHRLKESWQTLKRHIKNKDETKCQNASHSISAYQGFLHWLQALMFDNIRLGSAFPRRTTCLAILSLVAGSAEHLSKLGEDHLLSVYQLGDTHTQTLLDCLVDTFEENKMAATKILSASMKHGFGYQLHTEVESLFNSALELSTSNRPQDSTSAAYLLKYLLLQPSFLTVMKTYASSLRTRLVASDDRVIDSCPALLLLSILLMLLEEELSVARSSLTLAAANGPMYPTLHCIRYILAEVDYKSASTECLVSWRDLFDKLIHLCLDLSTVVSPVVQASSPEGNVPLDIIKGLNLEDDTDKNSTRESSDKLVTLMPEFLVVCCWRTIKEVSLVFGYICQNIPIIDSSPHGGIIDIQQLLLVGDYFKAQLLESIHRGAFELTYTGFVQMCDMLWRSLVPQLHQLPRQWLQTVLSDIKGNNSNLCATRRSAGVPFYVQALVSTEPSLTGRTCFKSAITILLCLAVKADESTDAQVHALNILRALFRDTRLGEDVSPYITDGLTAAILGFKSQSWAVRNSSTLLLSALMTRVFGVKRSRDESMISKKNCQTGRAFFHRYPALYQFLLQELIEATHNIDSQLIELDPSLYPVLMVLGRLFPSSLEGTDTNLNLAAFIPYIIKCASSPVYKTRMMAARALQPLVQKDQLISVILQLMKLLPTSTANGIKQSYLHGYLLQIEHLLVVVYHSQSDVLQEQTLHTVTTAWIQCVWLITRTNICLMTRKTAFDISDFLLSLGSTEHHGTDSLHQAVVDAVHLEISLEPVNSSQPFVEEFMRTVAHLCLKYVTPKSEVQIQGDDLKQLQDECSEGHHPKDHPRESQPLEEVDRESQVSEHSPQTAMESLILTLLSSSLYEVRLEVLTILNNHFSHSSGKEEQDQGSSQHYFFNPAIIRCFQVKPVFERLLSMALQTESHHSCIAVVFETLKNYPGIRSLIQQRDISEIFRLLLQRLKYEQRSEVKSSIVKFSGVVLSAVYSYLAQTRSRELYESLAEWCGFVTNYSQSDQCPLLQTSCARALRDNAVSLLADPGSVLGCLTFDLWEVVINLLQEDDLEVKDVTSSMTSVLSGGSHLADVQPTLALQLMVAKMVAIHGQRNRTGCIRTLITWIKNSDAVCENQEERLFDRGETNTYREDVLFVQLVAEQLEKITQQASLGGDGDHSISKTYRDARLDVTADQKSVDSLIMSSGEEHQSVDKEINLESKEPMSRSSRDASVDRGMELLDGSFVRLSVDPCQGEGQAVARDQESTSDSISQSSADAGHKDKRTDQESMDSSVSIPFGDASHQQYSTEPKPQKRVSEDAADKDDVVKQKSDDVQIEGLVADLLEFFSKKLNDMDVLDPVSPFRDSVLHEACLRTVQIASAVVRCTRHISKTVNLQPLHDHLQQILNSSCCEVYQTHLQNQEPPHSP